MPEGFDLRHLIFLHQNGNPSSEVNVYSLATIWRKWCLLRELMEGTIKTCVDLGEIMAVNQG